MEQSKVLIVEDDAALREALVDTLSLAGYEWLEADSAESALLTLKKQAVDIVISDVQMGGMDGLALLRSIKNNWPQLPVLLMTAYANIQDAVEAMKEGAIDYMAKPFAPEVLLNMVGRYAPVKTASSTTIAQDEKSLQLLKLAEKVAVTDANVMVLGPSGSGKEVMSRYIHDHSSRHNGPFVAINCAAIPDNMLEATLFGYEKGAFTGAISACPGKFEQAQGGTILLDEISEMDLNLQAKLLRVLQEREVERLGSRKSIQLDVRILATSNRDLKQYVTDGNFREDLYYRLNVFPIVWLPLSERKGDIIPLSKHLLEKHCSRQGVAIPDFTDNACEKLLNYTWPGNVRELENVIQRAIILQESGEIHAQAIMLEVDSMAFSTQVTELNQMDVSVRTEAQSISVTEKDETVNSAKGLGGELKTQEFAIIQEALDRFNGSRKEVADYLGISPRTLRYKLAKMRDAGIEIP